MAKKTSPKRMLDYKLVFDCLAEDNGKVSLHTLAVRWPTDNEAKGSKLPHGCMEEWRVVADKDGYIAWEDFSSGLAKALRRDAPRLRRKSTSNRDDRSRTTPKKPTVGEALLFNPLQATDVEVFLAECERKNLVQALARMRKEVYRCQADLEQQMPKEQEDGAVHGQKKISSSVSDLQPAAVSNVATPTNGTPTLGAVGNEKEELQNGIEILKQTLHWFLHRLKELELEKSSTKKLRAEELLAIMEGTAPHSSSQTVHHIQKINAHLSSLALNAPATLAAPTYRSASRTKSRDDYSGPGVEVTTSKGHEGHRHTHTSPSTVITTPTSSGARVIGIEDPPTSTRVKRNPEVEGMRNHTPQRSHSFQEIRLRQAVKRTVSSPEKHDQERNSKLSRAQSLNPLSRTENADHKSSRVRVADYSTAHAQNYPLRQTVSLNTLPREAWHGVGSGRPPIPHGASANDQLDGYRLHGGGLVNTSQKSLSTKSLASGERKHRHSKSRAQKEELRAKQVAAHQYVLQTEAYQGSSEHLHSRSIV